MSTEELSGGALAPTRQHKRRLWPWAGLPLALLVAAIFALPLSRRVAAPLPVLTTVPPFELVDHEGKAFGERQLSGHAWIANFVFTRCPTICPLFSQKMARLQEQTQPLGDRLLLVSFTVDPEYDTPERLLAYAQKYRAQPRWRFLTGSYERLRAVIADGMKVHLAKGSDPDDLMSIAHGSHFVLVDSAMQVRGYYRYDDDDALERLLEDARRLARKEDQL